MIGFVVTGVEATEKNGPFLPPLWDGEDGIRQGQIAYDQDGVIDPSAGPGPIWWDGTSWHRSSSADEVPNLQAVTEEGAITDRSITVSKNGFSEIVGNSEFTAAANDGNATTILQAFSTNDGDDNFIHHSQIIMQGDVIRLVISTGKQLDIINDNDQLLLRILPNGSGYEDGNGKKSLSGNGSPEGIQTAPPGSTYSRLNGAAGETYYIKQLGTGNTGWAPIA